MWKISHQIARGCIVGIYDTEIIDENKFRGNHDKPRKNFLYNWGHINNLPARETYKGRGSSKFCE